MLPPAMLHVAVVAALAGHLAQVPAHAGEGPAGRHLAAPAVSSRRKRPLAARSSAVGNSPAGAKIRDGSAGASVERSGSRERIAMKQTRAASRITMTISTAKNAARMPSTVLFVTT